MWCWRRLLRVPCTARRSNQSIIKEIRLECSFEGLMLNLKLQYFGQLMWRADSFEKTLMLERLRAGGESDDRGWDGLLASMTQWTWVWVNSGSWWCTGRPGVLQSMGSQRVGHDWLTELNWTESLQALQEYRVTFGYSFPMQRQFYWLPISLCQHNSPTCTIQGTIQQFCQLLNIKKETGLETLDPWWDGTLLITWPTETPTMNGISHWHSGSPGTVVSSEPISSSYQKCLIISFSQHTVTLVKG